MKRVHITALESMFAARKIARVRRASSVEVDGDVDEGVGRLEEVVVVLVLLAE